jgi:hypothetical protein
MTDEPISGIHEIDDRWNAHMLSLVRKNPIEANGLKLVFDRTPDIFLMPRLRSAKLRCAGFFIEKELVGFAMLLYKEGYVKGVPRSVLYFGNLFIASRARGRVFLYRMSDFFLKDLTGRDSFGHAVILKGNTAASRLVNRFHVRFPHMPHSRVIGEWQVRNILLPVYVRSKSPYVVRHAIPSDIDSIAAFLNKDYRHRLFGPVISKDYILNLLEHLPGFDISNYYIAEDQEEIVGVCCAWDMSPVKKNYVLGYNRTFKWVRRLVNAVAWCSGYPGFPSEGEPFRDVTITDYGVKDRNPEILKALLLKVYREYRNKKYHLMIIGHAAQDPLRKATSCFASQSVVSEIHIFSKSKEMIDEFDDRSYPWIDMTLL